MTTLCLTAACGPTVGEVSTEGDSEGESESTTGTPDPTNPTNPNPTTPNPTEPGTGDVTGDVTTDPTATGPDDTTGDPPNENCCEAHPTPTCNEPDVVDCVCAQEAFCCAFEWDDNCVEIAQKMCEATCDDPGETTGGEETTTGLGDACEMDVTLELFPVDATLSGDWQTFPSMYEPYEIASVGFGGGADGSVLFEPDIPCADTWYIWVRYWDQENDDSYYVTLDGEPMDLAVFEGDCMPTDPMGSPYEWAPLNWRNEADPPCTYVEDPWAPDWGAGVHEIEFSFRESVALGQILITNDQNLVPADP